MKNTGPNNEQKQGEYQYERRTTTLINPASTCRMLMGLYNSGTGFLLNLAADVYGEFKESNLAPAVLRQQRIGYDPITDASASTSTAQNSNSATESTQNYQQRRVSR